METMETMVSTDERFVHFPVDLEYTEAAKLFADIVADGCLYLNIDLFGVDILISRQISIFIMLHKELTEMGGVVRLINVTAELYKTLDMLNLDRIISIERLSDSNPKNEN